MKYKYLVLIILLISSKCSSRNMPGSIPMGKWEYHLKINGITAGSAVISNSETGEHYISETEMKMVVGKITNISRQVVTETKEFKPVRLVIDNSVNINDTSQKIITRAEFKDKTIEIETMGTKSSVKVNHPFVIDGNYFISKLIRNGFKEGYSISSRIYEPSIEPEDLINVTVEVKGIEKVEIDGEAGELIHIVQSIENFKSVDIYINFNGIMEKAVINMLNNRIELVKK